MEETESPKIQQGHGGSWISVTRQKSFRRSSQIIKITTDSNRKELVEREGHSERPDVTHKEDTRQNKRDQNTVEGPAGSPRAQMVKKQNNSVEKRFVRIRIVVGSSQSTPELETNGDQLCSS